MVIEFDKTILKQAKKAFKLRGSIKRCAEIIKVDRTSIPRVIKAGTGEERIVNAITGYIEKMVS